MPRSRPSSAAQFKALEENAKRRARRSTHDALDRSLIDLTTFFRDVLMLQLHAGTELVNDYLADDLHAYANALAARGHGGQDRCDRRGAGTHRRQRGTVVGHRGHDGQRCVRPNSLVPA